MEIPKRDVYILNLGLAKNNKIVFFKAKHGFKDVRPNDIYYFTKENDMKIMVDEKLGEKLGICISNEKGLAFVLPLMVCYDRILTAEYANKIFITPKELPKYFKDSEPSSPRYDIIKRDKVHIRNPKRRVYRNYMAVLRGNLERLTLL